MTNSVKNSYPKFSQAIQPIASEFIATRGAWRHSVFDLIREKRYIEAIAVLEENFNSGQPLSDPTAFFKIFNDLYHREWNEELIAYLYQNLQYTSYKECDLLNFVIGAPAKSKKLLFLLELGIDINAKSEHGNTFLHAASRKKDKILKIALAAGADMHSTNSLNQTPLNLVAVSAVLMKNDASVEVFNYLVENNPHLLKKSDFGWARGTESFGTFMASKGELVNWLKKYGEFISKDVQDTLQGYRLLDIMK